MIGLTSPTTLRQMLLLALLTFLGLSAFFYTARADPTTSSPIPTATDYPLPNEGNLQVHDPSIIIYNDTFYLFKGAPSIDYFTASNISGPWTRVGTVLHGPSIVDKVNRYRPWAPTIIERNGTFYCFYGVTKGGTRNSAIGVATSETAEPGSWRDHGALINTGAGNLSDIHPYTVSNAIDPSVIIDPADGKAWLTFGSYWTDLWQVPLSDDMLSVENAEAPAANHLSYLELPGKDNNILGWYPIDSDPQGARPEEGSWISYKQPYYYLWFSRGKCCGFKEDDLPPTGEEYSIRVGRSLNISGPYVDINGQQLLQGGGHVVYGSNHDGQVYAPGGLGVLSRDPEPDILYYHYLNRSIGLMDSQTRLGWNYLTYNNGWPVPIARDEESSGIHAFSAGNFRLQGLILLFAWGLWFSWS
ncbi:hypothetical protein VTN77DRAFT_2033 [Rasamsonia byssochlamydoides]|uniref:uncharacterized protein n=1 Tax=Rasamsonia byssochlamydoides TaxID=89139 RepID=UPI0037427A5B